MGSGKRQVRRVSKESLMILLPSMMILIVGFQNFSSLPTRVGEATIDDYLSARDKANSVSQESPTCVRDHVSVSIERHTGDLAPAGVLTIYKDRHPEMKVESVDWVISISDKTNRRTLFNAEAGLTSVLIAKQSDDRELKLNCSLRLDQPEENFLPIVNQAELQSFPGVLGDLSKTVVCQTNTSSQRVRILSEDGNWMDLSGGDAFVLKRGCSEHRSDQIVSKL